MRPKRAKIPLCSWKLISPKGVSFDLQYATFLKEHKKSFLLIPNFISLCLTGDGKFKSKVLYASKIFQKFFAFSKIVAESKG